MSVELDMTGRKVVVAGGASGIGRATVTLLRAAGARTCILDLAPEDAGGAQDECIAMDIADESSVQSALGRAAQVMGGLDGLVNTAGIFDPSTISDTDLSLWNRMIAVNLTGTYLLARHAIPLLRKQQSGSIVLLASGVALVPPGPGSAAYVASKGGVLSLGRSLAREAAPKIRVNCVCPGMVDTPMTRTVLHDNNKVRPEIVANYALQRAATAEEIAQAILWLTSSASSYVTGIAMPVDGGRTFH
jgi:NAD(P)-dependent dehydrogenase (short-subunit alcohol dehydrogenase family)